LINKLFCSNIIATVIRDETLGHVALSCARRPAFFNRKKLPKCIGCLKTAVSKPGVGEEETTEPSEAKALEALPISETDLALLHSNWKDREDFGEFELTSMQWMFVDSHDGEAIPQLVGYYKELGFPENEEQWSTMAEIRRWIQETIVTGPLSDREFRAQRRSLVRNAAEMAEEKVPSVEVGARERVAAEANAEEVSSLVSREGSGYVFHEILQRAAMSGGQVWYQVSYGIAGSSKDPVLVWEPASAVPREATQTWSQSRHNFKYSNEELELMKLCAGSLKENQTSQVFTNAGIFVTIMNCGIILSIVNLVGAESLSQVYMHISSLYHDHGDVLPGDFGYDDGCHLRRFAELRQDLNARAKAFWLRVGQFIFVDRFHWKNHKNTHVYCTEHCNPDKNRRIDGANTEICEQSFRWFSRHKYSVNHMTPARFTFFFLIIADRRNQILLEKRK